MRTKTCHPPLRFLSVWCYTWIHFPILYNNSALRESSVCFFPPPPLSTDHFPLLKRNCLSLYNHEKIWCHTSLVISSRYFPHWVSFWWMVVLVSSAGGLHSKKKQSVLAMNGSFHWTSYWVIISCSCSLCHASTMFIRVEYFAKRILPKENASFPHHRFGMVSFESSQDNRVISCANQDKGKRFFSNCPKQ